MIGTLFRLGKNGVHDWLWQRFSAVVITIGVLILLGHFVVSPLHDFVGMSLLTHALWFKVTTSAILLAMLIHAWIGLWTVCSDYLQCSCLRLAVEWIIAILSVVYLVWGGIILWG